MALTFWRASVRWLSKFKLTLALALASCKGFMWEYLKIRSMCESSGSELESSKSKPVSLSSVRGFVTEKAGKVLGLRLGLSLGRLSTFVGKGALREVMLMSARRSAVEGFMMARSCSAGF